MQRITLARLMRLSVFLSVLSLPVPTRTWIRLGGLRSTYGPSLIISSYCIAHKLLSLHTKYILILPLQVVDCQ
jgi:hypothetical protein